MFITHNDFYYSNYSLLIFSLFLISYLYFFFFFFFQAEDGIRDLTVTGVQTCALPICSASCIANKYSLSIRCRRATPRSASSRRRERFWTISISRRAHRCVRKIGRASCRGRG